MHKAVKIATVIMVTCLLTMMIGLTVLSLKTIYEQLLN